MQSTKDVDNAIVAAWSGIILAGGFYPLAVFLTGLVIAFIQTGPDLLMTPYIGRICIGLLIASFVGLLWAGLFGLVSGTLTIWLNWSFRGVFSPRTAVIIHGGMAGFVATFPVGLSVPQQPELIGVFLCVTPLAMLMGYIGGITMASKQCKPQNSQASDTHRGKYRFQIRDMFVATFWFAVVFAIERLVGDFTFTIWIGAGICLLFVLFGVDRIWLWFRQPKTDGHFPNADPS